MNSQELMSRMFENPEKPSELFNEIEESGEGWRAEHLDLPVTLLFLSRIKRALPGLAKTLSAHKTWSALKARGQSLARRRALFVAAEALGSLRRGALAGEHSTIRKALGVVVEEGTTLQKVRALRALSFIPSDECIPILKRGMQDRSPWVQATALNILLNMNLRQSAPRKVLTDFLFDRFERQIQPEEALNLRALVKNFHVNKGLFVGLLKAPGGKRLALLSLRLWVTSTLLTVLIILLAAARVVITVLGRAAGAIFIKPRKTLALVYRVVIWPPYKILSTPLWARRIKMCFGSLHERYVYLALLDYVFIYLLVVAGLPHGAMTLALALAFYWILLACSGSIEDQRTAERFRLISRCAGAALLAYTNRASQDERVTLAFYLLAAVQGIWLLPLFARAFVAFVGGVVTLVMTDARVRVIDLWDKAPPRERILSEMASMTGAWLRALWRILRPRLKQWSLRLMGMGLLLAAAYYALRSFNLTFSDTAKLMGPELGPRLVSLKPCLYFAAGGLIVAIQCVPFLAVFHLLWDELWIVERVRFRIRSRNFIRFKSVNDFLAYVFHIMRDQTLSTGLRVRAAFALAQIPLATQAYVDQLTDLAEEDLPINVSDAVSKVAEDADKRLKRGQTSKFEIDMGIINRQLEDIWKPGEILRPLIRKGLAVVLLPALLVCAAWLYFLNDDRLTSKISLECLVLGCWLVLLYICTARRESESVKRSLLYGLILLTSVFVRPLQSFSYGAPLPKFYENGTVGLVELSTFSSLIVPAIVAGVVAQIGHTIYLLGGDVNVDIEMEGKPNFFERKLMRLKGQKFIIRTVLPFAVLAVLVQSQPLQGYLDHRGEKLPFFHANGNEAEVELKDIPTDGRVVRVALVKAEDQFDWEVQGENKTPSSDRTRAAFIRSLKDEGLAPLEAESVAGDVWLYFQDGKVRWWWTSPIRCLEPSGATGDVVTFNLHSRCSYGSKIRFVAVIYDKRRSDFLKGIGIREVEQADINAVYPADSRLLLDTLSPFVKAVWSPVFSE